MTQAQTRGAAPLTGTVWLRDQVCEGIREQIITGRLKPGDRLVERDVAEEFGVSRIPVREAIRILMSEGFLQALSPRRIVVKELSRQDVVNLFDMREALEVLAARRAAEHADEAQLRQLKRLLESARKATLAGHPDRVSQANTAFHHAIVETAGNELLAATLEPLEGRLHWLFHQIDDPSSVWEEHRRLYETIAAGDAEAAAACALTHVNHYREVALRLLFVEADPAVSGDAAPGAPARA